MRGLKIILFGVNVTLLGIIFMLSGGDELGFMVGLVGVAIGGYRLRQRDQARTSELARDQEGFAPVCMDAQRRAHRSCAVLA